MVQPAAPLTAAGDLHRQPTLVPPVDVAQLGPVLGVETSCDETATAVVDASGIRANVVSSQIPIHRRYGGVVPEIASRHHLELVLPVIDTALNEAGLTLDQLAGVAVTRGPGLIGALLVGLAAAKAVAFTQQLPLVGVHHSAGHVYANFLAYPQLQPPVVCLIVSGGHTELVYIPAHGHFELLGQTRDDAAGEAFDKIARVLGLPYPGGPALEALASSGDPQAVHLPRALLPETGHGRSDPDDPDSISLDFSFSGLKTATLQVLSSPGAPSAADLAASFQQAIVDVCVTKTIAAAHRAHVHTVLLAGGVAANQALRQQLAAACHEQGLQLFAPPLSLCTDNGAMIAAAGRYLLAAGQRAGWDLDADPNLPLTTRWYSKPDPST
ncbi:MAG: tRNA (adenosine(37)-N6)-threonylcarbamoyltransferase complex transferase subunit TsaD [Limnochordaceae bacterium]|nr:tRNA (adenosine(37)-N6)-threonylcarbamoyltransferase complex transferase subunit TsaD [Limnochordaceae bacterium]